MLSTITNDLYSLVKAVVLFFFIPCTCMSCGHKRKIMYQNHDKNVVQTISLFCSSIKGYEKIYVYFQGSICTDCLTMSFCGLCAICQMQRELDAMGL